MSWATFTSSRDDDDDDDWPGYCLAWTESLCQWGDYLMEEVSGPEKPIEGASEQVFFPPVIDDEDYAFARSPSPKSILPSDSPLIDSWNDSCNTIAETTRKRRVTFAKAVEVTTYEVLLGDHPACQEGMAIECGWAHSEVELVDLDLFELRSRHRPVSELYLDFFTRQKRLQAVTGMTACELLQAEAKLREDDYGFSLLLQSESFP